MIPADYLTLQLELSRPAAHDCEDLVGVPVMCRLPMHGAVDPAYLDAVVECDVRGDDGEVIYSQDQVLRWQSHSELNIEQLRDAYERFCEERAARMREAMEESGLRWLARQMDFDQRPTFDRAA